MVKCSIWLQFNWVNSSAANWFCTKWTSYNILYIISLKCFKFFHSLLPRLMLDSFEDKYTVNNLAINVNEVCENLCQSGGWDTLVDRWGADCIVPGARIVSLGTVAGWRLTCRIPGLKPSIEGEDSSNRDEIVRLGECATWKGKKYWF